MNYFHNLKIQARLTLGFGIVLAFASCLLILGLYQMHQLQGLTNHIFETKVASMQAAVDMREQGRGLAQVLRKMTAPRDQAEAENEIKRLKDTLSTYASAEAQIKQMIDSDQDKAVLQRATEHKQIVLTISQKIHQLVAEGNYFDAAALLQSEFAAPHEQWISDLGELARLQHDDMELTHKESLNSYQKSMSSMLLIGILTLALGAMAAWMIARSIIHPLRDAAHIADRIANSDLSSGIDSQSQDELGDLLRSLSQMQNNLLTTISQIKNGTETITVAAREIASGNADLSQRTELQSHSLETTVNSMEELTSAVRHNTDNAQQANRLVVSASQVAVKGGDVIDQVVSTMGSIKDSSRKIVDIISVIDSIAFQTNILALNAAVEAARAGEQGRGFAVVAAEVRNLAQRSATAAKEIKTLIDDSVGKVEQGSALVDHAGKTMHDIVSSVKQVAELMNDMSHASVEQSSGIEQVNQAIASMDTMTQQNAALVEQAAAAAESMEEQAIALAQAVSIFKLVPSSGQQLRIVKSRVSPTHFTKLAELPAFAEAGINSDQA